jgi:hypothetical protein
VTALVILGAFLVPPALGWLGLIGWQVMFIAEAVILAAAAWAFDRGRRLGAPDPFPDANRADVAGQNSGGAPVVAQPKEVVETPADRPGPAHDPTSGAT